MRKQEREYRKSILPEFNTHEKIVSIDGFVDKIRPLDPKDELDALYIKDGNKFEATVGYPESLGEQGNRTTFVYKEKPTVEDIRKDLLEVYCDFKKEVNEPTAYDIVAKSGRDEEIERVIDRVLKRNHHSCSSPKVVERKGMEPLIEVHQFKDGTSLLVPQSSKKTFDKFFG